MKPRTGDGYIIPNAYVEGYDFIPHGGMLAVRIYIYIHNSQLLSTTYQHRVLRNRIRLMNIPSVDRCKGRMHIEYITLPVVMATHKGHRVYPVGVVQMPSVAGSIYAIITRNTCKHHDYRAQKQRSSIHFLA